MPLQPKHLDYMNTQFLVIGEGEGSVDKATQPQSQDEKEGKEKPLEEMEKLEGEDEIRVKHLKSAEYPPGAPSNASYTRLSLLQGTMLFLPIFKSAQRSIRRSKQRGN
jgi:hypothetical protein